MIYLLYVLLGKVIAIAAGLVSWRYLPKPYRLVLLLAALGLGSEIGGYYIGRYLHQHNAWLFNFYMPFEPVLLGLASLSFIGPVKYKKVVCSLILLNFMIWLFELFRYSIYDFASLAMICGCFLLVAIYIGVLVEAAVFNNKRLIQEPVFWLSLSVILYFGCDIPFMGMAHYMSAYKQRAIHLSDINLVLNFIRYPLVAVSFLLAVRERRSELNNKNSYASG